MIIVADQNIPEVEHAFSYHGTVQLVNGRNLSSSQLVDADALIVRSVTKVNAELLENSRVKFVGSATIGMDHVDQEYLKRKNIFFTRAPGCNATSAAEYVVAAVLHVAKTNSITLSGVKVGVVGYGNVGSRTVQKLQALGCPVVVYDPPREHELHDREYVSWDEICACDIVSAHVPLTRDGVYPTYHMFNQDFFDALKTDAVFINTSRGSAVDETALKRRINSGKAISLVLDVWQNEPNIDLELLEQATIATPHIAGYSREGKFRGLQMIYDAACRFFQWEPVWSMQSILPVLNRELLLDQQVSTQLAIYELVKKVYDITLDDRDLRKLQNMPGNQRGDYFDGLRKNYPERREFFNYQIKETAKNKKLTAIAKGLGFTVLR